MKCKSGGYKKRVGVFLATALLVPVMAYAATFVMPAASNYFTNHLFNTFTGTTGAAASSGQVSTLHTFTATQIGTGTGVGVIAQFTPGNLPAGSGYPATAPRMGELSETTGLGVGGIVRYTFNQALPLGTHVYLQDVDQNETATLTFRTCAGAVINPTGFDYLRVSTLYTPDAVFNPTNVVVTHTTGFVNRVEPLVAIIIRDPNVCRIDYTGRTFAGGTFETYFSLPPTDLSVTKSLATPNPVLQGSAVSWTVTITNTSPATGITGLTNPASAYGVSMADAVNSGVTGLTAAITAAGGTTGGSCTVGAGNAVSCSGFSPLATGSSIVITLSGTLAGTYAAATLDNTATVTNITPNDIAPGNNTATSSTPTQLQPNFGTCDARMFLSQGPDPNTPTTLQLINAAGNPFTYPVLGVGTVPYNAIGFNPLDNFVYGMRSGTGAGNVVVRVGLDGSTVTLGSVTGIPINANLLAGDISATGVYYVKEATASTLYAINLGTMTATGVPLSQSFASLDMAWIGGTLYTVATGGQLYSINPATGNVTAIGSTTGLGSFGALYGSPNGLFANNNNGNGFYQYDLLTGIPTLISSSPGSATNDGAHCVTAPITFGADIAVTKTDGNATYTPGTNVVYTITATNAGPFGAQNVTVSDPLPAGITTASWTCVSTSGGSACGAPSGTGAINDTALDLPVGAVATYTLTMAVPGSFTGNLVNTVTATVAPGTTDPTPGNNTATDTNTQNSQSNLLITKTNNVGTVTSGGTTTYTIVATNNGPSPSDNAIVRDDWTTLPGLDCSAGPATCAASGTAGTQCPAPASVTPAGLQAGLAVPVFPSGGIVTFTLQCAVTATGNP